MEDDKATPKGTAATGNATALGREAKWQAVLHGGKQHCEAAQDKVSDTNDDPLPGNGAHGHFGIALIDCMGCNQGRKSLTSEAPIGRGMQEILILKSGRRRQVCVSCAQDVGKF